MRLEEIDRAGLMREAYRIEGIGTAECRAIFMDWALQLPETVDVAVAIGLILDRHGRPGHPMTEVLQAGLEPARAPRRRGGRGARRN